MISPEDALPAPIYNYTVVRQFTLMTLLWGILGMSMGVFIAAQLVWPELNFGLPWLSFGRIRPIHTNLVIFAFGGGALFATSFYVVQRTSKARLISDSLASFVFWGWQAAMVAMARYSPLTRRLGRPRAECSCLSAPASGSCWATSPSRGC